MDSDTSEDQARPAFALLATDEPEPMCGSGIDDVRGIAFIEAADHQQSSVRPAFALVNVGISHTAPPE